MLYPAIIAVFFMLLLYIYRQYHFQELLLEETAVSRHLSELQSASLLIQSEKVKVTRKERIEELIRQYGIDIVPTPVVPIKLDK